MRNHIACNIKGQCKFSVFFFMQRKKNLFIGTAVLKFSVDKHMYTEDIWIVK